MQLIRMTQPTGNTPVLVNPQTIATVWVEPQPIQGRDGRTLAKATLVISHTNEKYPMHYLPIGLDGRDDPDESDENRILERFRAVIRG